MTEWVICYERQCIWMICPGYLSQTREVLDKSRICPRKTRTG